MDTWTIKAALDWTTGYLERKGDPSPRVSAQWLIGKACGLSRIQLYTDLERPLSMDERDVLRDFVKRRAAGEPLQYIVGEAGFRFLTLQVARGVLIPRPETEVLVSELLQLLPAPKAEGDEALAIADVGCGSGCIACSIASERPDAIVYALDISPDALELTRANAKACGLEDRVRVRESDMLRAIAEELAGSLHAVISNPPYIPTGVLQSIPREVTDFEPLLALDGGADGLDPFRALLEQAPGALRDGGILAVELHEDCLEEAARLASQAGFTDVAVHRDLADKPRVLTAIHTRA